MKLYKILWNSLPQNMVELLSLASLKDRLAKHFRNRKMNFFYGILKCLLWNPDHLEEFCLWSRVIERKKYSISHGRAKIRSFSSSC